MFLYYNEKYTTTKSNKCLPKKDVVIAVYIKSYIYLDILFELIIIFLAISSCYHDAIIKQHRMKK